MLDEAFQFVPKIDQVIVEKQIGKFGFKQLEYAIFMYLQLRAPGISFHSIHPSHKLKVHFNTFSQNS